MDINEQNNYIKNDELKIYRGEDFVVSKHIKIHQATLDEICDYGEQEYYSMVYNFVATPQSYKVQLWDMDIDYTEMTPYELFYKMLCWMYPQEKTSILFGDLDFKNFKLMQKKDDDSILLYQETYVGDIYDSSNELVHHFNSLLNAARFIGCELNELVETLMVTNTYGEYKFANVAVESIEIDEYTYNMIVDYISKAHFIERDFKVPANNSTKMVLIEDARDEIERNKNKEYCSQLKNLISTMINSEGFKYNHAQVWDMKINAFMDSVKRVGKIKNATLLLQSGYSGYGIDLKGVDKKQLDWFGELE